MIQPLNIIDLELDRCKSLLGILQNERQSSDKLYKQIKSAISDRRASIRLLEHQIEQLESQLKNVAAKDHAIDLSIAETENIANKLLVSQEKIKIIEQRAEIEKNVVELEVKQLSLELMNKNLAQLEKKNDEGEAELGLRQIATFLDSKVSLVGLLSDKERKLQEGLQKLNEQGPAYIKQGTTRPFVEAFLNIYKSSYYTAKEIVDAFKGYVPEIEQNQDVFTATVLWSLNTMDNSKKVTSRKVPGKKLTKKFRIAQTKKENETVK